MSKCGLSVNSSVFQLTHPQTEKEYILHIDEIKQETADFGGARDQSMEYPACYTQMTFRIEPDMMRNQFRIVDCSQSDQPRYKEGFKKPDNEFAVAFGIIGGASTPILMSSSRTTASELSSHMAMSSLHFEPAKQIEWRIVFQEIPNEDLTVSLI